MTLEDKIYPKPAGPLDIITRFDNTMIKGVGKAGEFYQNLTGKDSKNLVKLSYRIGSLPALAAAGIHAIRGLYSPLMAVAYAGFSAFSLVRRARFQTAVQDESEGEFYGNWKNTHKWYRFMGLTAGSLALLWGYSQFIGGFEYSELRNSGLEHTAREQALGNPKPQIWVPSSEYIQYRFMSGVEQMSIGASLLLNSLGNYLSRADIPKPPNKTYVERAKEFIFDLIGPKPATNTYS